MNDAIVSAWAVRQSHDATVASPQTHWPPRSAFHRSFQLISSDDLVDLKYRRSGFPRITMRGDGVNRNSVSATATGRRNTCVSPSATLVR